MSDEVPGVTCECDNYECRLQVGITQEEIERALDTYCGSWFIAHPSHKDEELTEQPHKIVERNDRYIIYTIGEQQG